MTARSILRGLWRGLDGLRRVLHLIVLLVVFGLVFGALRGRMPHVPGPGRAAGAPRGRLVEQLVRRSAGSAPSRRRAARATPRRCCGT